jgi:glycosyltransferase involved in cell wall biosynthesis
VLSYEYSLITLVLVDYRFVSGSWFKRCNQMKKLLIFHQALAPYRVDFFNHLAKRFDAELVLFDTNLVNQKFDQNALVRSLKCRVSYLLGGFQWKDRYFRTGAIRKIWKERPDIVIGCEYSLVTIAIAFWRFLFRSKFQVYSITDDNIDQFRSRKGLKVILRWCFVRLLDGFVVTNSETKLAYEQITPKRSKIKYFIIPILHDENEIRKDAEIIIAAGKEWREYNCNGVAKVVLFVGRLNEVKNVKWLVENIRKFHEGLRLVLVGSGPQEEELKKYLVDHDVENVLLVGRKEGREVYEMMSMADCLILSSKFEPYGAVVGEALQWGTPCLVSDKVGAKGLIVSSEGVKKGEVFSMNDGEDFAEKLNKVLGMKRPSGSLIGDELGRSVDGMCDEMLKGGGNAA